MRGRSETSAEFPIFPIGPVLESYGGQPVVEGFGWKPYRCPFHGDRDASGSVNSEKQVFNCHAADCPKGNAIQVIMQWEQVSYAEAKQRAETISGAGMGNVQPASGRRGRMAGGSRSGSGVRSFKRTWRSS
jgi:hypothetical protein